MYISITEMKLNMYTQEHNYKLTMIKPDMYYRLLRITSYVLI